MKLKKMKNTDIAITINKQYQKSYTPNYISTIFRQRIIPIVKEMYDNDWTAEEAYELSENLRMDDIKDDSHVLNEIYTELKKGLYFIRI